MDWLRRSLRSLQLRTTPRSPSPSPQSEPLENAVPIMVSTSERVAMGLRCRDCDEIPKVDGAGRVLTEADGRQVQVMHNGLRVLAGGYYGDWMSELIGGLRGHHEPQEERLFHELVQRLPVDATMIELGGFWSYYSLWFLQNRPERRAVVLEPDPVHLAVGEANAELNALSPVFVQGSAAKTDAPPSPFQTEVSGVLEIPRWSVPGLMSEFGLEQLDLLHCDAQGAEYEVLEGCLPLAAAGRLRWVCISTHHHAISGDPLTHQRCLALLHRAGAQIEAEHDVHESFSGDGLILARFGPDLRGWNTPSISRNRASTSLFRHPLYDLAAATRIVSASANEEE